MIWISVLALTGALSLVLKDAARLRARQAFVILVSLFVVHSLVYTTSKGGKLAKAEPIMESDRAELLLRFDRSMQVLESWAAGAAGSAVGEGSQFSALKQKDFHSEAKKVLEESIDKNPDLSILKVKLSVVLADAGRAQYKSEFEKVAGELASKSNAKDSALGKALRAIYLNKEVPPSDARAYAELFQRELPGWYRDAVLLRLYKVSGESKKLEVLKGQVEDK